MRFLLPISASKKGKICFGFVNVQGEVVIQPKYHSFTTFKDGVSIVSKDTSENTLSKIVNWEGEIKSSLRNMKAGWEFSEGISHGYRKNENHNAVLFNRHGDIIYEFEAGINIDENCQSGKILVSRTNENHGSEESMAFFDLATKTLTDFRYHDFVTSFYDGIALVSDKEHPQPFFIDENYAKISTPGCIPDYSVSKFNEGFCVVKETKESTSQPGYTYINKSGKYLFSRSFLKADVISQGYARVQLNRIEHAIINTKGKVLFSTFEQRLIQNSFMHGVGISFSPKHNKYALINVKGDLITDFKYNRLSRYNYEVFVAAIHHQSFYIDSSGKFIHNLNLTA